MSLDTRWTFWVSLKELGEQVDLDAAVDLLTLRVSSERKLAEHCQRILASRRDRASPP